MEKRFSKIQGCVIAAVLQLTACLVIYRFNIVNPNVILFVVLSSVLVKFGYRAGIVSGIISFLYSAFFFSADQSLFVFEPEEKAKMIVVGIGLIANIVVVGHLQKQMEKANRAMAEMEIEKQVNHTKEQLLANMSHDVRTPINGILGMIEVIKKNPEDSKQVLEYVGKMECAANQLLSLTNDVLDTYYLQSGNVIVEHVPIRLSEICEETMDISRNLVKEENLIFSIHYGVECAIPVLGSPYHIRRILLNLYSNAVKYNRPGGRVDTELRLIGETEQTASFQIRISDTGIGMSREFMETQLFQLFSQENPGARTQYQGCGLGMSIVQQLVEKMNGTIQVDSEVGQGTMFTLEFTFEKSFEQNEPAKPEQNSDDISGIRILLVEDNELNMEIAEYILEEAGAVVTKAENGEQAVQLFTDSPQGTFDMILSDIMMPVMDGLEATRRIRSMERADAASIPIVAMTANVFPEDVEKMYHAGMNGHISKPISEEKLLSAVKNMRTI